MPDMAEQAQLIIEQLDKAFAKTPKPGTVAGAHLKPLAPGVAHPAADLLNNNLRGKTVGEIEADWHQARSVAEDLPELSPPAIAYYLPGLLRKALRDLVEGENDESLMTWLTLSLSNEKAHWPHLTPLQQQAVRAWVDFVGTHLRTWDLFQEWEQQIQQQLRTIRKAPWLSAIP